MATPVSEHDYLDQDPQLRGQRYACISFVSPEEVLMHKDVFVVGRFLGSICKDLGDAMDNLAAKFAADPDLCQTIRSVRERYAYLWKEDELQTEFQTFKSIRSGELDEEFHKMNHFKTSIRGFKIRGVYDSVGEATDRAKAIKKFDDKFHVFVAEVGCWCPWSPNPDDIKESEYAETQLNTLMKHYHAAQEAKAEVYEQRKEDLIRQMNEEREAWLERKKAELARAKADQDEEQGQDAGFKLVEVEAAEAEAEAEAAAAAQAGAASTSQASAE
jgi:hypothetical protein